jgi:catechol 2,3-dioxygenase-like lactoylglutathione lyase family enzyme
MRLNHLDIHVEDITATTEFLTRHFGLKLREVRGKAGLAILDDDAGTEIVVSRPIEAFGGADQASLGRVTYHLGFIQPERGDVDRLYAAISDDIGVDALAEPREIRGGYVFYCLAPGRVLIEVGWRPPHQIDAAL